VKEPSSPTDGNLNEVVVVTENAQDEVEIDLARWGALAKDVLSAEGATGELALTFVGVADIRDLKLEHFGDAGDYPTDVLSFPLDDGMPVADGIPQLLGDVVVCPAVSKEQAPLHAGNVDDEIALLVVHGILHILGFDHATAAEQTEMQAHEREHLVNFFWHGEVPDGFSFDHRAEVGS
jgi:probable rRNA maturation factor